MAGRLQALHMTYHLHTALLQECLQRMLTWPAHHHTTIKGVDGEQVRILMCMYILYTENNILKLSHYFNKKA